MSRFLLSSPEHSGIRRWLAASALLLATLLAYLPALEADFIWDDDYYVTENEDLWEPGGLGRIWTDLRRAPQYYPMVHSLLWLEYRLFGLDPRGYHLANVLLHAAAAIILWRLLIFLRLPGAWVAAAVFALHPVHVESVAWITEHKNTLSAVFYLLALRALLPVHGIGDGGDDRASPSRLIGRYVGGFFLFIAALLSKTVTCSLPAALLLLVWWRRGRLSWRDALLTAPMFAAGLMAGLLTAYLERDHVGAMGSMWDLTFLDRCLIAGRALWFYAGKLVWPRPLLFIYPRWEVDVGVWWQWLFPLAALAVPIALWALRDRLGRGPLTAYLFFAGTLFPALGFFNVYFMQYSYVADHFQYLASLGVIVAVVATAARLAGHAAVVGRRLAILATILVLTVLAALSFQQSFVYRDSERLWRTTLAANPDAWMALDNLAGLLEKRARALAAAGDDGGAAALRGEATGYLERTLTLHPDDRAYGNLGQARLLAGRLTAAVELFEASLELEPTNLAVRLNLAVALDQIGRDGAAAEELVYVLALAPDFMPAIRNLANLRLESTNEDVRDPDEAWQLATRLCELTAERSPRALALRAAAETATGRLEQAVESLEKALAVAEQDSRHTLLAEPLRRRLHEARAAFSGDIAGSEENP